MVTVTEDSAPSSPDGHEEHWQMRAILAGLMVAVAACSGNTPTKPTSSGDVGVIVGNNFMKSPRNGTINPAVDTVPVSGSVTWTWTNTGNVRHGIQSLGSPSFPTGTVLTGDGKTYRVTFNTAGTYRYDCVVHGSMMPGTIVVIPVYAATREEAAADLLLQGRTKVRSWAGP
jgi:plastocyanin